MKEATGELNMTVITLVAIAAIGAVFYFVIWPIVQRMLIDQTCKTYGDNWVAVKGTEILNNSNAQVTEWSCCPSADAQADQCIGID